MRPYRLCLATLTISCLASAALSAQQCPVTDVRAALAQACPCASARSHGQLINCVQAAAKDLRANGCDVETAVRCTETSTCGRPGTSVVCCNRKGHAQILPAAQCSSRGGRVATGATSVCDAGCAATGP